jgi:hypothetical protein
VQAPASTAAREPRRCSAEAAGAARPLFNKQDYNAAERYWSSNYIQHSAHIAPGRDGLFNLVKSTPGTLKYEPGLTLLKTIT